MVSPKAKNQVDTPLKSSDTSFEISDPSPSSRDFNANRILDEKGPPGHDGRYLVDWAPDPQTKESYSPSWERKSGCSAELVKEWVRKKKADPQIVGRHGGEPEDLYERSKEGRGYKRKRGTSDSAKNQRAGGSRSASFEIISETGAKGGDDSSNRARKRQKPPRPPAPPRIKPGWEYVEVDSQEQPLAPPDPNKLLREARRAKRQGLTPATETSASEDVDTRAIRTRNREGTLKTIPKSKSSTNFRPSSTKDHNGMAKSPSLPNVAGPSKTEVSGVSHDAPARSSPVFEASRSRDSSKSAQLDSKHLSPRSATSASPRISKSPRSPAQRDTASSSKRLDLSLPTARSQGRTSSIPPKLTRPLEKQVGPVPVPTASQFKRMLPQEKDVNAGPSLNQRRTPSPSRNDTIVPFSSPLRPSAQDRRTKLDLSSSAASKAKSQSQERKDTPTETPKPDMQAQESQSSSSSEEEPPAKIVKQIINGEEVLTAAGDVDSKDRTGAEQTNDRRRSSRPRAGAQPSSQSSSDSSSEEDTGEVAVVKEVINGEEVWRVPDPVASGQKDQAQPLTAVDKGHAAEITGSKPMGNTTFGETAAEWSIATTTSPTFARRDSGQEGIISPPSVTVPLVSQRPAAASASTSVAVSPTQAQSSKQGQRDIEKSAPRIAELEGQVAHLQTQVDEGTSRVAELENKLSQLQENYNSDTQFLRAQYDEASTRAVEEVQRSWDLEQRIKVLKGQLDLGLKQRKIFDEAVEAQKARAMTQKDLQLKFLLDQARMTDDSVRAKASAYGKMKYERDQLLVKNAELHEEKARLEDRNEELRDQVALHRAKLMGVFGDTVKGITERADDDDDDEYSESEAQTSDDEDDNGDGDAFEAAHRRLAAKAAAAREDGDGDVRMGDVTEEQDPRQSGSRRLLFGESSSSLQQQQQQHGGEPSLRESQGDDVFTASQVLPSESQLPKTQARLSDQHDDASSPQVELFRCLWRDEEKCRLVFRDKEDLRRHVDSHIPQF